MLSFSLKRLLIASIPIAIGFAILGLNFRLGEIEGTWYAAGAFIGGGIGSLFKDRLIGTVLGVVLGPVVAFAMLLGLWE